MDKKYYLILFVNITLPCATCYLPSDTPLAQGTNNAVIFLLGTISFVLVSIILTCSYFYYRSKRENYGEN